MVAFDFIFENGVRNEVTFEDVMGSLEDVESVVWARFLRC